MMLENPLQVQAISKGLVLYLQRALPEAKRIGAEIVSLQAREKELKPLV